MTETNNQSQQPMHNPDLRAAAWLKVFTEIWLGRGKTLKALASEWRKIIAAGLLLYIVGHVFSLYIYSQNSAIRSENEAFLRAGNAFVKSPNSTKQIASDSSEQHKQNPTQSFDFTTTSAVQSGLIDGIKSLVFVSLLFWLYFSLIGGGISYKSIIAGTSSGLIIASAGMLLTSLLQNATGSLRIAPNAGIFIVPVEFPWLYGFLTNIGIFPLWEYIAIGLSLAYVAHYRPKIGVLVGLIAYCTMLGITGAMAWIGKLITAHI